LKLKINNVEFRYNSAAVLDGITMELADSEIVGIVGPNGAGKSTLIRCINNILQPNGGSILLSGKDIHEMSMMEIAKQIGYVPQTASHIFPATVFETVLIGRRPHIGWKCSEVDEEKVWSILKVMGIEDLSMRDFNEISGGQQQKVLIARALAQEPGTLILDEPTSNLDIRHQLEVMEILKGLVLKQRISVIMAVHDLNLVSRYADRLLIMKNGKIFDAGSPFEVLTSDNIMSVYGVEAEVINSNAGVLHIVPLRSAKGAN
jgi:iron complex transport system ATP-binding protein